MMQETEISVRKRDGRVEAYDRNKLRISLTAAALAVVSTDFRDDSLCKNILSVLGLSTEGELEADDTVRGAYTREIIGDEIFESIEFVVELVESSLEELESPIDTGELSALVHKALVEAGQGLILNEYVMRASSRERAIVGASAMMKAVRELTFTNSQHSNAKRDNANVNGETAMGTMLQYGATASKTFAPYYLIAKHIADMHNVGGIHIHDLEFYMLTLTCIPSNQRIVVRHKGRIEVWQALRLSAYTSCEPIDFEVWSGGSFVKVHRVMSKPANLGASVLSITTKGGGELRVSPEHFVTVYNEDGTKSDVIALELKKGMKLVRDGCSARTPLASISLYKWFSRKKSIYLDDSGKKIAESLRSESAWARKTRGILSKQRIISILSGASRLRVSEYQKDNQDSTLAALRYTTRDGKRSLSDTVLLSDELARFMGYMLASGSLCSGGLMYNAPDETTLLDFKRCAEAVLWKDCASIENMSCKILGEEKLLHALFEGPLGYLRVKKEGSRYVSPYWLSEVSESFLRAYVSSAATSRLLPCRVYGMYDTVSTIAALGIDVGLTGSKVLIDNVDYSVVEGVTPIEYTGPLFDIETENHHFSVNGFSVHNCCQIDLDKLFDGGFNTGHGHIRPPARIDSYAALTCIAIQSNQNDQHGGQSIPALDYYLERGVARTFATILAEFVRTEYELLSKGTNEENDALEERISNSLFDFIQKNRLIYTEAGKEEVKRVLAKCAPLCGCDFEKIWSIVSRRTEKSTRQAMESLVHNLNSMHSRAGAQIPFSSINFGTATSWEGRLISHKFLDAIDSGLGNGETPIFPISIFKMKEGVNVYSTDPNYDIFKKAIHVTARRMYPNFSNIDAPFNQQYYEEGNFATEVAYMGCLAPTETVAYRYKGSIYTETFEQVWDRLLADGVAVNKCGLTMYMEPDELWAYDSRNYGTTKVKTLIRNTHVTDWIEVCLSTEQKVYCTPDHPWPTDKGRKVAEALNEGDKLFLAGIGLTGVKSSQGGEGDVSGASAFIPVTIASVKRCNIVDQFSYDFETESGWFDVSGLQSFNCRTRVIADINGTNEVTGRGNLSFTTINLPQIALQSSDIDTFYGELAVRLDMVLEQLLSRLDIVSHRKVANMPFLMGQGIWKGSEKLGFTDEIAPVMKHGTLSIGFVGLAETLSALTGYHHGEKEESQKLGLEIISFMRKFCDEKSLELSLNVTLLATPAESACGRFLQLDRKKFGIVKGVTDHEYYTNSFHVPVWYRTNARHKVEVEAPYHALTNAGHITYVELDGDAMQNKEAVEDLVMLMYNKNCGYFAVSHAIDVDPVCGYTGYIGDGPCPRCGRNEFDDVPFERGKTSDILNGSIY